MRSRASAPAAGGRAGERAAGLSSSTGPSGPSTMRPSGPSGPSRMLEEESTDWLLLAAPAADAAAAVPALPSYPPTELHAQDPPPTLGIGSFAVLGLKAALQQVPDGGHDAAAQRVRLAAQVRQQQRDVLRRHPGHGISSGYGWQGE